MKVNHVFPECHLKESEHVHALPGITARGSSTCTGLLQKLCSLSRMGTNSIHWERRSHQGKAIFFYLFFLSLSSLPRPSGLPPLFSKFCNASFLLPYSCFSLCLLSLSALGLSEHPWMSSFQSFYALYLRLSCCPCSTLRYLLTSIFTL